MIYKSTFYKSTFYKSMFYKSMFYKFILYKSTFNKSMFYKSSFNKSLFYKSSPCFTNLIQSMFYNIPRRRANARNVSYRISLRWPIHIINPVDTQHLCFFRKLTPLIHLLEKVRFYDHYKRLVDVFGLCLSFAFSYIIGTTSSPHCPVSNREGLGTSL